MERPEFDIVVVHHSGDWFKCVESIVMQKTFTWNEGVSKRITLVNTSESSLAVSGPPIRVFDVGKVSWVRAANAGLSLSTAPYVVLMNDDVEILTEGWLEKLRAGFDTDWGVGCVSPHETLRKDSYSWSVMMDDGPLIRTKVRFYPEWEWLGLFPISFWCVMFKREALIDVGLLDLRFADGYGADDDDWQLRAHRKGWEILVHPGVHAKHKGSASWGRGEKKSKAQARNLKLFQEKWRK